MPTESTCKMRRIASVRLEVVRDRAIGYPCDTCVGGPSELASVGRALVANSDRELFSAIYLSSKHKVNAVEAIAVGTLNTTLVHPREVFKGALLANAAAIALVHNHPSGDPTPSPEDLSLTLQLLQAGELIGVRVLDHIVVGDPGYVSIRESTELWHGYPFHR